MNKATFYKKLLPLGIAQTFGVFNDNAFKSAVIFIALGFSVEYSKSSFFIALMTVVYAAPFILFTVPAGYLADKFPKRNVIIGSKFAEIIVMLLGLLFFYLIPTYGIYPVVIVLFLMATQSSAFSPSYNSILPEIFSEQEISRANGILGMFTFLAVIIGFSSGIIVKALVGENLYICGVVFSFFSLLGFLGALGVERTKVANRSRQWNNNILREFIDIIRLIKSKKIVFISILGEAYFFAIGVSIQTLLILFGKFSLRLKSDLEIGLLQLIIAIGMGLGCYLGGRLSRKKLEIGLAPFGFLGMSLFFALIHYYKGGSITLLFFNSSFVIYPVVLFSLVMGGIFAGIFVIPLRVCQQERTNTKERGKILACVNFFTFAAILISGAMTYLLTGKHTIADSAVIPKVTGLINRFMLNLTPGTVLLIIAILNIVLLIYAIVVYFDFLYRAIAVLLTRTIYKVTSFGETIVPQQGSVLLVSNHVSYLDTFFISSCTSRKIHFVIHKDYYKHFILRKFYKYCGFIEYPEDPADEGKFFEKVNTLLRNDKVVCVFPEMMLTRNGLIGEFKLDLNRILRGEKIPIIPVHLSNLWGSVFSYYYDNIKLRIRCGISQSIRITFGQKTKTLNNFKLRQALTDLSAMAENVPGRSEQVLHLRAAKLAKRHPFRKSFIDFDGAKLNRLSLFLRAVLMSRKIRNLNPDGKYIGVLLPNCTAAAASILGVMIADKIPVILNYTLSEEIFDSSIKKAGLDVVLTSKLFIEKINMKFRKEFVFLEGVAKTVTNLDKFFYLALIIALPYKFLMSILSPKSHKNLFEAAMVLFSSGSSGIPKGVVLSHHNLNSNVNGCRKIMKCNDNDIIAGNLPFFHSFGINVCFWIPLMINLRVVYIKNPLDAASIVKAIKEYKLTLLMSTPTFLQSYMRKSSGPSDFKSLRLVIVGAEKMRMDLAEEFKKYAGIEVTEGFGCTELSPVVSINVPSSATGLGKKCGVKNSIGCAITGQATKIVDIDSFDPLSPNKEGLLFVKGPNVMKGYLGEPEETRKAIINGWYNTGDIGKMDEAGYITLTGRLSRFSKIGGEMISHELVEHAIHEVLKTEERKVAITGIPDKTKGEKLVVLYEKLPISRRRIIKRLQKKGLNNIWIPKSENFIKIKHLPLLGTGKLDITKLNQIAMSMTN